MAGTNDRVYGGDPSLIHIADGERAHVGDYMAAELDEEMRKLAFDSGARDFKETQEQLLCPGCYMVAGYDMLVTLAKANGQSLKELALTMAAAFTELAKDTSQPYRESITVILDPCEGEICNVD